MTAAVVIECEFDTLYWHVIGISYSCNLSVDPLITSPGVTVTTATGDHKPPLSHADILGFYSSRKTINFMPRGLNDVFPNLSLIYIYSAGMKEIHQSDLKQFPRLRFFSLYINAITVVEQDLFKFNPELEYISLDDNKITQIHPTVFDHLSKLVVLCLESSMCIDAFAYNRSAVEDVISTVKHCAAL
jgi:Leucine-rich repeat (LRR) protein